MGLKEKCHTLTAQAICQFLLTGDVPRRNIITKHTLMIHGRIAALLTQIVTILPQLCRYCPLWGLILLMVLFSLKAHSSGGKDLYTMKECHFL